MEPLLDINDVERITKMKNLALQGEVLHFPLFRDDEAG